MKKQTTVRDGLYKVLDTLINACKSMNRELPSITLTSAQFQIFQMFNHKIGGVYRYRGIEVKKVEGNVR